MNGRAVREEGRTRGDPSQAIRRVLVVHHATVPGGAEASLETHLRWARVFSYGLASPDPAWPPHGERLFCQAHLRLPTSRRGLRGLLAPWHELLACWKLARIARRYRPALIVAYASLSAPAAAAVSRLLRIPFAWHVRESTSRWFPAKVVGCAASRIIVPSHHMEAELTARLRRADASKIDVVPSPIDPERYGERGRASERRGLRQAAGLPSDGPLVLMIGQHVRWKGHLDLAEALPLIRRTRSDAKLVIVGGPWTAWDASYSREMRERMKPLIAEGSAFLHPPTPSIERYYRMSDVLVLPSRGEPFGRVVFEAFAAGLPAVVSADAGVASYVEAVAPDLLFQPGDREDTARAIAAVLTASDETRIAWIARGRKILEAEMAPDAVIPKIEQIYLRAIGHGAGEASR